MAFDSLVLAATVAELKTELLSAKVNKIHQPDRFTVVLRYHGQNGAGRLLISAHPENGRVHKTETAKENPDKAPLFAMVMRKWLEGARITALTTIEGERILHIFLDAKNDIGDIQPVLLVIEIMGKHSNIILVDVESGLIIDGIHRYNSSVSRYREVLPGKQYLPPPPLKNLPLPPKNEEDLATALYAFEGQPLSSALIKTVRGLSPLTAHHMLESCGLTDDAPERLGERQISQLYHELLLIRDSLNNAAFSPTILKSGSTYKDFAAILPKQWPPKNCVSFSSMNEAIEFFYATREQEQDFNRKFQSLNKSLGKHVQRLSKKIALQEADLFQSEAGEAYRQAGDLLAANLWRLNKGMEQIELASFDEDCKTIVVKLLPELSPQENVQRYYRLYTKAKKSRKLIEAQLCANQDELDYLLSIEQALIDSRSQEELTALEKEAVAAGYYRPSMPQKNKEKREPKGEQPLAPRHIISQDGLSILIGRNNKQNDYLSLKQAGDNDIWLHAQKIPGSHVIIQSQGKKVPDTTLAEAAAYAAWHSKARYSNQVPVDYVQAGKLKKPPGSKPGFVTYTGQNTLFIKPKEPAGT